MNEFERQMVEILTVGRSEFDYASVKAEFEAEGTRTDELVRLAEIANAAGLPLTIKIGGCEAVRDLMDARLFGASYVVAPMIESRFALSKYIGARNRVYGADSTDDTSFLFNMETITCFERREEILDHAAEAYGVDGVVFGRVDFSGSLQLDRVAVNSEAITHYVLEAARSCRLRGLDFVVGGGVSLDSLAELENVRSEHLTRFETRKVVIRGEALDRPTSRQALLAAMEFELLWLLNKREHYNTLRDEDDTRIAMLEARVRS
ncbi:aldolase/citrate lyase family protein [Actinotalea subterranea]|uniref:aldolase/citrate lyase family protein n=1 Tax=Actinotalea subterranea TaxID=2607497 RepID=UPI0011EE18C4|nr:aldolase/citrate lyase family protein [Actinotalea subterranea]